MPMRGLTFHELWITPHRTPLRGDEVVMLFLMQAIEIVLRVKHFLDVEFSWSTSFGSLSRR